MHINLLRSSHWAKRLSNVHGVAYERRHPSGVEMVLTRTASDVEYELHVVVDGEWIPEEPGSYWHPSFPSEWTGVEAWAFRAGRGWKQVQLTEDERDLVIEHLRAF